MIARSWLFCPADRPDRLTRAVDVADVAVADLEDAVATDAKERARATVAEWLAADPARARRVWVRVNNEQDLVDADLDAIAGLGIAGVVLPKADLVTVTAQAGRLRVPVLPLVETAAALWRLPEIAAVPGVATVTLGEYDLAADLGVSGFEDDPQPLAWARSGAVAAAAGCGLVPPPAPVTAAFDDREAFTASTRALQRMGFAGRMCIHPRQVEWTHDAVRPGADDVERARAVLAAAQDAERKGSGVAVVSGRMVDAAVVRRARRVLALAAPDAGSVMD